MIYICCFKISLRDEVHNRELLAKNFIYERDIFTFFSCSNNWALRCFYLHQFCYSIPCNYSMQLVKSDRLRPLILISTRATEWKISESWATSIRVTVFLERTEIDTNDHLFGRAHKSVQSCKSGKIGTPHISETAWRVGDCLEKSSPSVS